MRVPVKLAHPDKLDKARETEDALVDAGARWTAVPREIAGELGLKIIGQIQLRTAAGPEKFDQSFAYIELQGKSMVTPVVVTDAYPGVLIGVITLEGLGFAVDPTSERLVDSELLLL